MSTELPNRLKLSTDYKLDEQAKSLIKSIIEGFKYHPLFFMFRNSVSSKDPVYPFAHQLELLGKLFVRRPIRVIIGDEIGLGKTVSAIMLIRYLLEIEGIEKILILVPRVLVLQWLAELKRFNLTNIYQLERETITTFRNQGFLPGIYLASIDLVKRDEYKKILLEHLWDLVVVDEAHRIGKIGSYETQRYILVNHLISKPNVHVVMLTATPHRGKNEDYIERLKLIDPYLNVDLRKLNNEKFYRLSVGSIIFRRTKFDVNEIYEKNRVFTDCKFIARVVKASEEEEVFHKELIEFLRSKLIQYFDMVGEPPRALPLLITLIAKRASSSPKAAILTLDRIIQSRAERIRLLKNKDLHKFKRDLDEKASLVADTLLSYSFEESGLYEDEMGKEVDTDELIGEFVERCSIFLSEEDFEKLKRIHELARKIMGERDSRLASLINVVLNHLGKGDRIVVFTEFKDTAEYIFSELRKKLPTEYADKIAMVSSKEIKPPECIGEFSKQKKYDIESVKEWLRKGNILLLVSTDVASEGLNLQVANIVIHYEPTWSPVKIVQRIGRVWRLGQKKDVRSYSLLLTVESDMATLEILYAKLLSWIVSGIDKNIPIGEELEIDMSPRDRTIGILLQTPIITEKGRFHYSEFKAWIEFIAGGKDRLRKYVEGIVNALINLKKQAERLGLNRIREDKINNFLGEGLGGLYGKEAEKILISLLKLTARYCGYEVEEKSSGIYVHGTHLTGLKHPLDMYRAIESLLRETAGKTPVVLVANKPNVDNVEKMREIYLYEVVIYLNRKPVFSETIGVVVKDDGSTKTLRGSELLKLVSESLNRVIGIGDIFWSEDRFGDDVGKTFKYTYCDKVLWDYIQYINESEKIFNIKHVNWIPGST
ncbi:MAG: DEAD/DEAH box helicase [Desulfurococcaceae archaeon]